MKWATANDWPVAPSNHLGLKPQTIPHSHSTGPVSFPVSHSLSHSRDMLHAAARGAPRQRGSATCQALGVPTLASLTR